MITLLEYESAIAGYDALVALHNAVWPDEPRTVAWYQYADESHNPAHEFQRWAGYKDDTLVAVGEIGVENRESAGVYYLSLDVHPDHRRMGTGSAMYQHLLAQLEGWGCTSVVARTREDLSDAIRFLQKRGFQQEIREPGSQLDLTRFERSKFEGAQERVAAQGIRIASLAELSETVAKWKYRYYEIWKTVRVDVPSAAPVQLPSFKEYMREALANPGFNIDGQFVALDGDAWVGCASIWTPPPATGKVYTGLTGVVRSHRRSGIATALKLRTIRFAQAYGATTISTANEENNPMYQLNLRLGFEPQPAWLSFRLAHGAHGQDK